MKYCFEISTAQALTSSECLPGT